ncbi:MAG: M23 family metallopeptidase [Cyclobacteriaceae bacterium]
MARIRYTYNPTTCKYEPVFPTGNKILKWIGSFIGISFLIGLAGLIYFNLNFPSWDETQLQRENLALKNDWQLLDMKLQKTEAELAAIEQNDDNNYRVILDIDPLPLSVREAGVGGREPEGSEIQYAMVRDAYTKSEKLMNRLDIESQSIDALGKELERKEKMWASRPAIQPISNEDLTILHTTFGLRLHPILGYWRDHKGLDFTAPQGTPVYATGDGEVHMAYYSETYGYVVYLDHGYGFETRYAHLTHFIVGKGERVKRGQIVGYVGTTGLSKANHLHYEVLYKNDPVNPINFFQRDLSNKEFQKLVERVKLGSSLD